MIEWISVKDKMPPPECGWAKTHYLVLLNNGSNPPVMAIAKFFSPLEDQEPKWHPINYDNEYVYSYENGGLESDNDICADDHYYYKDDGCTRGKCLPVSVTYWSPIEWISPGGDNK